MSLQDLPWGFWNGLTAWVVLVLHAFGAWTDLPLFDVARAGNWYDFGFLVGAGSPLLGAAGAGARSGSRSSAGRAERQQRRGQAA